jgi:hypothetical protein
MAKGGEVSVLASMPDNKRWQVERDLEYLMEAEKIKGDPKRLKLAQALAKERMMSAAKVAGGDSD